MSSAEAGEGRAQTEENIVQSHMYPTQSGERMSQGLRGVRQAVRFAAIHECNGVVTTPKQVPRRTALNSRTLFLSRLFSVHNQLEWSITDRFFKPEAYRIAGNLLREPRLSWLAVRHAFRSPSPSVAIHLSPPKVAFVAVIRFKIHVGLCYLVIRHYADFLHWVTSKLPLGMAIQGEIPFKPFARSRPLGFPAKTRLARLEVSVRRPFSHKERQLFVFGTRLRWTCRDLRQQRAHKT